MRMGLIAYQVLLAIDRMNREGRPAYGMSIHREIVEASASEEATVPAVYSALARLRARNLVHFDRKLPARHVPGGRQVQTFKITAKGGRTANLISTEFAALGGAKGVANVGATE